MAKLTENYEAMVVFSMKKEEEEIKTLIEKFTAMISAEAEDVTTNEWGKRKLAYAINYENEGYYVLWNFTAKPEFPAELERVLGITDGVIRFLITLK
ncbi:MAG: 30S ribosomal protein S6 [Ruminococcus sp.]|nr:30S ribosomal protein S6 [Ruminococcus sp.]